MKRLSILFLAMVFIFGCRASTLVEVRAKWGPHAEIAETEKSITWFYFFHQSTARVRPFGAGAMSGYIVVEILADKNGKISDVRKYWKQPEEDPTKAVSTSKTGTGFAVSSNGEIVTACHIIENAKKIEVQFQEEAPSEARVLKLSKASDVAILKIDQKTPNFLALAEAKEYKQGQKVFTMGFPVTGILGAEPKYSEGSISSLSGIQGEDSLMQITVPVQPGNSGGPLLNENGKVVGLITSTAAVKNFLLATGTLPQNINWAVKSTYVEILLGERVYCPNKSESIIEHTKKCIYAVRVRY